MHDTLLIIGLIVFIIYVVFNIFFLIDVARTSAMVRKVIIKTEADLNPALAALKTVLENVRRISDNAAAISGNLREVTDSVADVEKGLRQFYTTHRDRIVSSADANIAGLKAGVKTGVSTLVKKLTEKEGSS